MFVRRNSLALLLLVCTPWATADESLPRVVISYGGWYKHPIARHTISDARKHFLYRIESHNYGFFEYVLEGVGEDAMLPCNQSVDDWFQVRMVIDISDSGHTTSFFSDGKYLFSEDLKRCRPIDEAFKERFVVSGFGE